MDGTLELGLYLEKIESPLTRERERERERVVV
jgi:hypothetical protein